MRTYTVVIPAGGSVVIDIAGEFFKLISYTGTAGTLTVKADSQSLNLVDAAFLTVLVGDKPRFRQPYDKLTFINADAVQVTAVIIAGMGDHDQDSLVGSVSIAGFVSVTGTVQVSNGTTLVTTASITLPAASSSDFAANGQIRERLFMADAANTAEVWYRDQAGVTSAGTPIGGAYPMSFIGGNSAACRLRNNSGAAQTVHYNEHRL